MSVSPYVFGNYWPNPASRMLDQDFGLALSPDDLPRNVNIIPRDMWRPFRQMTNLVQHELGTIKTDKDKFQVNVDVQHFAPEEISVKIADGFLTVEGKHEDKRDEHGYISRQFTRRYELPEGCHEEAIQSRLSSDGVLTITAPRQPPAIKGEKAIPIQHTGPVRKEIKGSEIQK